MGKLISSNVMDLPFHIKNVVLAEASGLHMLLDYLQGDVIKLKEKPLYLLNQ